MIHILILYADLALNRTEEKRKTVSGNDESKFRIVSENSKKEPNQCVCAIITAQPTSVYSNNNNIFTMYGR